MHTQILESLNAARIDSASLITIQNSITRLSDWLEANDYKGYDTFDGLSSAYLRPLTFDSMYLRIALQQSVRRLLVNIRPLVGIPKCYSSKAMGFLARGFLRLYAAVGEEVWRDRAEFALRWIMNNRSEGYSGACWGNHFDYQSRTGFIGKDVPTVVWTSLIGHAFLDAFHLLGDSTYLRIAESACTHIVSDLNRIHEGKAISLSYTPMGVSRIHNANVLGASLLARVHSITGHLVYRELAEAAARFTCEHQLPNGGWYYGEEDNLHWVDNFHTGYVLDSLKHYSDCTKDRQFDGKIMLGYEYWKNTFFLPDGTPRYYNYKTLPIDIQCSSQAIDTLLFYSDRDPAAFPLALKVARWTIGNMQDKTGYFYYRRYPCGLVNKTPTLHWGQATMLCALSGLLKYGTEGVK